MKIYEPDTILLIDNDPMNVFIFKEILGGSFHVEACGDPESALKTAQDLKPALIMIDLMMHGVNGYGLCRKLRANPRFGFTKIILISTKALIKDRLTGYEAGADDYIARPFDPQELMAKVNVFLRLKNVEEIDRVKDDLINVFSHETRTPLNAIIGFAKLLADSPNLSADEQEFVHLIAENGLRLLALSNKAVMLINLRREKALLHLSENQLEPMILASLRNLPESLASKNLQLSMDLSDELLMVDSSLITTALQYVFANAYRFSPVRSQLKVFTELDGKMLKLNIRDSGCGIPPARLPEIFDEFGVADIIHHGNGHGLSLAIVKAVMNQHSGSVSASNNPDGAPGTTITLTFNLDFGKDVLSQE